jgi:hypothetical protein
VYEIASSTAINDENFSLLIFDLKRLFGPVSEHQGIYLYNAGYPNNRVK